VVPSVCIDPPTLPACIHIPIIRQLTLLSPPPPRTPAIPESPEDLSEEELEALQQQMDEDFELATGLSARGAARNLSGN
jgi:hypothetical protein